MLVRNASTNIAKSQSSASQPSLLSPEQDSATLSQSPIPTGQALAFTTRSDIIVSSTSQQVFTSIVKSRSSTSENLSRISKQNLATLSQNPIPAGQAPAFSTRSNSTVSTILEASPEAPQTPPPTNRPFLPRSYDFLFNAEEDENDKDDKDEEEDEEDRNEGEDSDEDEGSDEDEYSDSDPDSDGGVPI